MSGKVSLKTYFQDCISYLTLGQESGIDKSIVRGNSFPLDYQIKLQVSKPTRVFRLIRMVSLSSGEALGKFWRFTALEAAKLKSKKFKKDSLSKKLLAEEPTS